ncbi:uncharacterized protein TRIADDRAFT_50939 [Trichoplax adhaerens]|uniref:Phosphotransferase n=1 Tax=Trichoplax adhaerens TaxID=10228 RepID=B3S8Y6_TRIAD|nr:hypothetical protein TRIADDRAFT_50939 [Trichoplax adhaerens]EDV20785.1 hypothetical protein TRIADDRAFT_50939 [Trichoplax adhaerens]|eukprot:XP_002116726.1 hypothetical protein TRIADDRAFT_50939 [Trichoplax adhaerens]
MADGLSKDKKSSLKMLPSFVRSTPTGKESGDYLALDIGGTNFRVLRCSLNDGQIQTNAEVYPMSSEVMTGTGRDLFAFIADCIKSFLQKYDIKGSNIPLGFTFSFPCTQHSLNRATLITWTKGFTASGVEGEEVVQLLQNALAERCPDFKVNVAAIVNDTVGTLMASAYENPKSVIGLIIGTGTNACYMEQLDAVEKWTGDRDDPKQVIINIEWGSFGDHGHLDNIRTGFDREIDEHSLNRGKNTFEKMISGMYLGEVVRLAALLLVKDGALFNGNAGDKFNIRESFETRYVSEIVGENGAANAREILKDKFGIDASESDVDTIVKLCNAASVRAGRLAATGIAAILLKINETKDRIVAVDGSVYKKHPTFAKIMSDTLSELIPGNTISWVLADDGSGVGAAMVAAVTKV